MFIGYLIGVAVCIFLISFFEEEFKKHITNEFEVAAFILCLWPITLTIIFLVGSGTYLRQKLKERNNDTTM